MDEYGAAQSLTLGDVSREHRRRYPDRVAVVCGEERLTFSRLDDRVNRIANLLLSYGADAGEIVLWLGQNCHRAFELVLAAAKTGAAVCPVNWRLSDTELQLVLEDLRPRLVVWQSADIGDKVKVVQTKTADLRTADGAEPVWIQHDTEAPDGWEAALAAQPATDGELPVDAASPLLVIYTAAFGGRPQAAQLNHHSLVLRALCEALANHIDHNYVYLNNGPMFHVGNWRTTMPAYVLGGRNVFLRRTDAAEMCRLVDREACTGAYLLPSLREQMAEANRDLRYNLRSLHDRTGSGPPEWRAMVTIDPTSRGYGQTETGGLVTTSLFGPDSLGNAGYSLPLVQVRVLGEDGTEQPDGAVGEIAVRGPTVTNGYRGADTAGRAFRNGWWLTGDLGKREPDGSITFVGPKSKMLKSGSENIYPAEVESCLRAHRAVADCAIIGVPDPVWTQNVRAIVVTRPGETVTGQELIEHCRARIASYKKPKSVIFADSVPRANGSIDYDALDARYGGGGYPGVPAVAAKGVRL